MTYQIPASLGQKRSERSPDLVPLLITSRIALSPGMRRVEIQTTVENTAKDHRLRAHFPVPVTIDSFQAEGHFDVVTRSLDLPTDTETWVEQPAPTHPQRTWSDVSNGEIGLLVANRGLPEVEVMRTDNGVEVALTLLRAVGWLSRSDMSVRRGHAGPGLPTPEAQCIGTYTMEYALVPHAGDWQARIASNRVFDEAHAFNAPMRVAATHLHAGTLPPDGTFAQISPDSLVFSALKDAEDGQGLILRLWNTSAEACEGKIALPSRFKTVTQCNLAERDLTPLDVDAEGYIELPVRGREVVTLRLK
jgi:alpha-mannosidase